MNLFRYEAQSCRKPSGFQSFATTLPGKFIPIPKGRKNGLDLRRQTAQPGRSPLFAFFLAALCRLPRHFNFLYEGMT